MGFKGLMELKFSRHNSEKISSIKFKGNPSIGSRFVPCGRTDNFAKAPKNEAVPFSFIKIGLFADISLLMTEYDNNFDAAARTYS
jgi:hypothetical protein